MKTPWYPGSIKPVRVGSYERLYSMPGFRDWWTGTHWVMWDAEGPKAMTQDRPWRGLTKEQK